MNMFDSIGFIAAFFTTMSFLPQVIKVLKTGDTQSLSLGMYIIFVIGVSFWLIYGIAKQDWPIIIANAFTLVFATTILTIKIRNSVRSRKMTNQG